MDIFNALWHDIENEVLLSPKAGVIYLCMYFTGYILGYYIGKLKEKQEAAKRAKNDPKNGSNRSA